VRIALVNNRWFMVGGTTRYLFNVKALLERHGHEILPFSNRYSRTVDAPTLEYFVDPPGGDDVFFQQGSMTPARAWGLFRRSVYDTAVKRAFGRLLDERGADLVYSVNICNFLSPSVIDAAVDRGVPYVMRLSDFNLRCPAYLYLRDNRVCEDCNRGLVHAIRHRCLQGSFAVSTARVVAMWIQRWMGVYHRPSRIVTPSAFLRDRLVDGGWDADRIDHIPTFVELDRFQPGDDYGDTVVFSGRLTPEKGPETLIRAAARLPASCPVRIVFLGSGEEDYVASLRGEAEATAPGRVEFRGFVDDAELRDRVGRCLAVALPARWYENMPNAINEAMAMARPVLSTPLGSLPEQVLDGETGRLIAVDDADGWAEAIAGLWEDRNLARRWGRAGRARAQAEFTPQVHYERLSRTFARARDASAE